MILEMRTTVYKPRSTLQVNARFEAALPERTALSPLAGFFHSDVGVLNSTVELWPYESLEARDEVFQKASELASWPPELDELRLEERVDLLVPASFNGPFETGAFGDVYEIRTYTVTGAGIDQMLESWSKQIDGRRAMSHCTGVFYSPEGETRLFVHIWPYGDAAERFRTRAAAIAAGIWPPKGNDGVLLYQQSMLALPAPFSPLH